jgi:hypothetical protein
MEAASISLLRSTKEIGTTARAGWHPAFSAARLAHARNEALLKDLVQQFPTAKELRDKVHLVVMVKHLVQRHNVWMAAVAEEDVDFLLTRNQQVEAGQHKGPAKDTTETRSEQPTSGLRFSLSIILTAYSIRVALWMARLQTEKDPAPSTCPAHFHPPTPAHQTSGRVGGKEAINQLTSSRRSYSSVGGPRRTLGCRSAYGQSA